jgi:hypothetical protein
MKLCEEAPSLWFTTNFNVFSMTQVVCSVQVKLLFPFKKIVYQHTNNDGKEWLTVPVLEIQMVS